MDWAFLTTSFVMSIKNEVTLDIVFDLTIKTPNGGWDETLNDVKRSLDYPNNLFRCAFGSVGGGKVSHGRPCIIYAHKITYR